MGAHPVQSKWPWDRRNLLKERLISGEASFIAYVNIGWPPVVEILGARGVQGVVIDLEHTMFDLGLVDTMITVAVNSGVTPLVRPSSLDSVLITRLLDAGAQGIVFPHVDSREHAEAAIASLRFPPRGIRGWGGGHSHLDLWQQEPRTDSTHGSRTIDWNEYERAAESQVLAVMLIESLQGVEAAHEIASVPGVDLIYFGAGDFSAESQFDADRIEAARTEVYDAGRQAGVGLFLPPEHVPSRSFYPGCCYSLGDDAVLLSRAIGTTVERARATLPGFRSSIEA